MGCFVRGDKNCMGCFVRGGKSMRDVLSGVAKNGMGCFVPGFLASLCSKYMPPANNITLHLDFHTFTVKHLSRYG